MKTKYPPGLIGVPCMSWMWSQTAQSLITISAEMPQGSGVWFGFGSSIISLKRNQAVEQLLTHDHLEWLLFYDADMTTPVGALPRLLSHDADIIGGLFVSRYPPYVIGAGWVRDRGQSTDPMRPTDDPGFRCEMLPHGTKNVGPVRVDVLGTGVTLIRRHVFEAMDGPWFNGNLTHIPESGEDYNFMVRARDMGFRIVCDTNLPCGHLGLTEMDVAFSEVWFAAHPKCTAYTLWDDAHGRGTCVDELEGTDQKEPATCR